MLTNEVLTSNLGSLLPNRLKFNSNSIQKSSQHNFCHSEPIYLKRLYIWSKFNPKLFALFIIIFVRTFFLFIIYYFLINIIKVYWIHLKTDWISLNSWILLGESGRGFEEMWTIWPGGKPIKRLNYCNWTYLVDREMNPLCFPILFLIQYKAPIYI